MPQSRGLRSRGCAGNSGQTRVKLVRTPNKVVLFYPPYDGPPLGAPLCLLALAAPLLEAGFEVKLVDSVTSPDCEAVVVREIENALCLGISLLTGPMIKFGVRLAREV